MFAQLGSFLFSVNLEHHRPSSFTDERACLAHWKFLFAHGQQHARLIRHQTMYSRPKHPRSLLITLLSLVLFLAPEVHLRDVEKLWTDEIIFETVWKSFMNKLLGEWEELILWVCIQTRILQFRTVDILSQSTVVLTANVGFLAIPGVVISDINNSDLTSASMLRIFVSTSQIASSMSILASVGSTVIGLLLIRHNRSKQEEDPAGAVSGLYRFGLYVQLIMLLQSAYLYKNTHPKFGLEPLAIIFGLPWALLMWA
jgi:hypothetical protein